MGRTQMLRKLTALPWNCKPIGPVQASWRVCDIVARMRCARLPAQTTGWFCTTHAIVDYRDIARRFYHHIFDSGFKLRLWSAARGFGFPS